MTRLSPNSRRKCKAHKIRDDLLLLVCLACNYCVRMTRILRVELAQMSYRMVCMSVQCVQAS